MSRTAVVTGGASGIGAALARALVARGDSVVIADLDSAGASAVAAELSQRGPGRARAEALDVRDAEAVRVVVEEAHRRDGRLDLLFNNAGLGMGGAVEDLPILDRGHPEDVPEVRRLDGREYLTRVGGPPYPADALAADVLRAVQRDRPVIVAPRRARVAWRVHRAAPWLVERVTARNVDWARDRYGLSLGPQIGTSP